MTADASKPASLSLVILSLALGAFAIGTSEFAAMGLLPWFAADLGLSEAEAGHVISAYAFGVVIGAPITTLLGARLPRRRYLAALIGAYGVLNLAAAILPGYSTLVGMRFLAGLPHGGFLGVGMLFAADALPREKRAKGVTQVILGLTVANIVGVPFAGVLGDVLGWRSGFALPGIFALIAAALILKFAPRVGVDPDARPMAELKALSNSAVLLTLLVGTIGSGGMFAVYAFMSQAMLVTASPPGWAVPAMLSAFGIGSTIGSIMAARMTIALGPVAACAWLFVMMIGAQGFTIWSVGTWQAMIAAALLLGLTSTVFVPLQTRLMDIAGQAQSMAAAMNHAAFNAANGLGPLFAGLALDAGFGWRAPGVVAIGFSLVGLLGLAVVWRHAKGRGEVLHPVPVHSAVH
ncbi:MFS transporter, DHA1 family, inner membrane transport protein [Paracoccus isoporae]|uniref:MFS transporter, DHA1 family, inner membrane transport protein n=1 Tax=Paracoccus isoporae TaxID=591205 RepID=A0A1G6WPL1_9RHOB|nr:MFS transporter [Paracoccus isoporae]SDD67729.1 MFS transporter, DHA1 family, inner membrane transport protein [Paracoccus isoporae]